MRKKVLLIVFMSVLLTACGSEPVKNTSGKIVVESKDERVAESTQNPTELVELKIPENMVVTEGEKEEVKEESKFVFSEEVKDKFSTEIEEATETSAECLGIEFRFTPQDAFRLVQDGDFVYKYAYFLINDAEIVRVFRRDPRPGQKALKLDLEVAHVTDFKSVDEFMEVALDDPFIVLLDRNSIPLFVDTNEIAEYIEVMEPAVYEWLHLEQEQIINNAKLIGEQEVDEVKSKEIVEQSVSHVSCLLRAALGENYSLLGYENKFCGNAEENNALVRTFVVEDEEGKVYTCGIDTCYEPILLQHEYKDRETFVEYCKWRTTTWVLWEDN